MHSATKTLFLAMATVCMAQSSTISLWLPDTDKMSLVGSIVGADSTATTYALACPSGTDSNDCGYAGTITFTEGPATAAYTTSEMDVNGTLAFAAQFNCQIQTSSAICTESFGGTDANFPGLTTETYTGTDFTYMPVVITAGLAKATDTGVSTTGTVSSTSSGSKATGKTSSVTKTGTTSGGVAAQTSSSASGTGSSTSTSIAGAMITGVPAWMMGGAALAVAAMA